MLPAVPTTPVGALGTAAVITTAAAGETATRSVEAEVFTEKLLVAYVAAAGLVIPATVNVADLFLASAHVLAPLFANVITTLWPVVTPLAVQFEKLAANAMVGLAGIIKLLANTAVTVLPAARAEELLLLVENPTVHVVVAPATWLDPTNVTADTAAFAC